MMLTVPFLALDDLYRLTHSSRAMSLIAKESIQKILRKDSVMMDLVQQAAYRVVTNTGLPIFFDLIKVPDSKVQLPIKLIGTLPDPRTNRSKSSNEQQREAIYSEISVLDGHLTR
jgi:hypothetical protein